jgi:hypothetical protein
MTEEVKIEPEDKGPGGRPAMYGTPDLMQQAIDLYFKTCDAEKRKYSITRLAYELGFESRQSFYDYEKRPEFSYIIRRARLLVEAGYEDGLRENNCTGSIFALKNMGWKDKTETSISDPEGNALPPAVINVFTTPKPQDPQPEIKAE